jgi:filamentous hemagglutinin family protein
MIKHLLSFLTTTALFLLPNIVQAQTYQPSNRTPVADSTLSTQVSGSGNFNITGGLSKGQTLFHSFTDFSVPTNGAANFLNPVGNRDIITRVTGSLFSDINGLVNSNGANFFLINPNGIVFGTNAQLNVGRAFMASTANGIDLVDGGGRAMTFGTNPNGDAPLLSVAPNVLFDVSRLNLGGGNGAISNFGTLQTTNQSQYIGLIGGNVTINGGKIIAPGGRIDLGGLNSAGTVIANEQGLIFGDNNLMRGDVNLTNGAIVSVRANETLGNVNTFFSNSPSLGSSINIKANNLTVINSGDKNNTDPTALAAIDAGLQKDSGMKTTSAGDININATDKVILNNSDLKNTIRTGAEGKIGNIKIDANSVSTSNQSLISANSLGKGNAGNINITTRGNITISGTEDSSLLQGDERSSLSSISSNNEGEGDTGKISVESKGDLSVSNRGGIQSFVKKSKPGNSLGISITAKNLTLKNLSFIESDNFSSDNFVGQGNAGNIYIKTTGNLTITNDLPLPKANLNLTQSNIMNSTYGEGSTGKITIVVDGNLSLSNRGGIQSEVREEAVGNGQGINITAGSVNVTDNSRIVTDVFSDGIKAGKGNAGNIGITTKGNLSIIGTEDKSLLIGDQRGSLSQISSSNYGSNGDAGKITIDTQGDISIANQGGILSTVSKPKSINTGNSLGVSIKAKNLTLKNISFIESDNFNGTGNAGDIYIKTKGDFTITNDLPLPKANLNQSQSNIMNSTYDQGNAGKVTIIVDGNLSLSNRGGIQSEVREGAVGNGKGINITAGKISLIDNSRINTDVFEASNGIKAAEGNAGNIDIKTTKGTIDIVSRSRISSSGMGKGEAATISINTDRLTLKDGQIFAKANEMSGGNIKLTVTDKLLMRDNGNITTNSGSLNTKSTGGNININSPLIIALPGNNDINANAYMGDGGKVKIESDGLFGIQPRSKGQASLFTNDITASSAFGLEGIMTINTPGTDPGKDSTQLPNTTTDASNQISQVCSANTSQNKLTVTGRGGLPPTANDPLTSDVVWQDARAASSQPALSSATTNPVKLAPPAVGWVFDGKGKVTLVAAGAGAQPTGSRVVCPNIK